MPVYRPPTPEALIEDLMIEAIEEAAEAEMPAQQTSQWEAAEMIENMAAALDAIADGVQEPADHAARTMRTLRDVNRLRSQEGSAPDSTGNSR